MEKKGLGPKRGGCEGKGVQTHMMLQTPRISTPLPDCQSKEKATMAKAAATSGDELALTSSQRVYNF